MRHYELSTPENFLGLAADASDLADSRVVVLPIPYEATVSYGQGTREGPRAIIHASRQVELYDRWRGDEPALMLGIHTLPALAPSAAGPEANVAAIAACAAEHLAAGKHLVGLGGEHTISVGIAQAVARHHPEFVLVQIDAHADLRDSYEGSRYSHACAARRILDLGATIVQLGIRSVCPEEMALIAADPERITVAFAEDVHAGRHRERLAALVHDRPVFLTIDLDGLDPTLIPATGTPEPGGLSWDQVTEIIGIVATHGRIVAIDCVELAPIPGHHVSEFVAAKLVYQAITRAWAAAPDASR